MFKRLQQGFSTSHKKKPMKIQNTFTLLSDKSSGLAHQSELAFRPATPLMVNAPYALDFLLANPTEITLSQEPGRPGNLPRIFPGDDL